MPLRPRHGGRTPRGAFWRHWSFFLYFFAALLGLALAVCFLKSGHWLVSQDRFDKARWALVLAGESRDGERSEAALKLYMDGRIDTLIYSGCRVFKDRYAGEFMTDWLAKQGYPREKLFDFRQDTYSTQEEAAHLIRQFRWQNLDTVLIITTNFHTARTRRIFRKLAQGYPHILVYPAEFRDYDPAAWWSSRESRKYWLMEWAKTISTYFELLGAPPETGKAEVDGLVSAATGSAAPAKNQAVLPPPTRQDSLAAAALDSAARADSAAARGDTAAARPTASGDSASSAADSAAVKGKSSAAEKPEEERKASKDSSGKESLASTEPAAKKETKAKEPEPAKSAAKPAAKSSKNEPASKAPAKKTTDKTPEKSSSKSDKDKKKSTK